MNPAWSQSLDYWSPAVGVGALLVLAMSGAMALFYAFDRSGRRAYGGRYGAALKDLGFSYSFDASRAWSEDYTRLPFFFPRWRAAWFLYGLSSGVVDGVDCRAFLVCPPLRGREIPEETVLAAFRTPGTNHSVGFRRELSDESGYARWYVEGRGEWLLFYRVRYPKTLLGWFVGEAGTFQPTDGPALRAFFDRALQLNRELTRPAKG